MEIQTINKEGLDTVLLKDSLINEIKNTLMSNFDEKSNSDEIKDNFSTNIGSAIANGVDLWLKKSLVSVEIDVNESVSLSSLKDVSIVSPVKNNILVYNGIKWENKDQSSVVSTWSELTGKPTTLSGYGISSSDTLFDGKYAALSHTHPFSSIINKPTTLSGYGIEDAYTKTAIDNALLLKLDKAVFDDLFEKVEVSAGVFAIKAKYNFYGVGEVSAYGLGNSGGGGTGASSLSELVDVSLTSLLPNQILRYNGTHWVNENLDIVTTWSELTGKPTTFPASPHIHAISEITGLQGSLDSKASATTLTNHIEDSDIHITSDERTNWNIAYANNHTHSNKTIIDQISQANLDVLALLSIDNGKLKINADTYSTGEISAYGLGSGGGGGTGYERLDAWSDYTSDKAGWVLSALLGNDLNNRVSSLEGGSLLSISTTGAGNAITSVSKSGNSLLFTKGSSFALEGHTHNNYLLTSLKGSANGLAELDANGLVPSSQLPSYVDDVLEYASLASFPATGETGKIYVAIDTNLTYRWSGTTYVEISKSLALGETSSTAYRGDRGKIAYDHSQIAGGVHVTSTERTNWNIAYANNHTHSNKTIIDQLSQSNLDVLALLSIDNGKLKINADTYSTGEISAYGAGSGSGGGSSYNRLDAWADYDSSKSGWVLSALLGVDLNNRLSNVEGGSATSVSVTGTGDVIVGGSKSGNVITLTRGNQSWDNLSGKPATFTPASHTHSTSDITSGIFNIARIPTGTSDTTVALGNHLHTGVYEPVFTKNTAFNKNFGTTAGTVAQGNDSRIINGQTAFSWGNHASAGYALSSDLSGYVPTTRTITAGNGLTGGGALSADRTLTLGTPSNITATSTNSVTATSHTHKLLMGSGSGLDADLLDGVHNGDITAVAVRNRGDISNGILPDSFPQGLSVNSVYASGFPYSYGNTLTINNLGSSQLFITWNSAQTPDNPNVAQDIYVRSRRDSAGNNWSIWTQLLTNNNIGSFNAGSATKLQTARTIAGVSFDGTANIAIPFANLSSKPTTLSGYGITDFTSHNNSNPINPTNTTVNSIGYANNVSLFGRDDGGLLNMAYSSTWQSQIFQDFRTGQIALRGKNNGTWTSWRTVWDNSNLTNLNQLTTRNFSDLQNKPTTLSGYGITDAVTTNTTQTVSGAKTFSAALTASVSVTTPKVIFAAGGWSIEQSGTEIQFKYNGTIKQRMLSDGSIVATGELTAYVAAT